MRLLLFVFFLVGFNFSFCVSLSYSQQPDEERHFVDNLNEKYSGSDFQYEEEKKVEETAVEEKPSEVSKNVSNGFAYFISNIFPYLLGLAVVLIILKAFVGVDLNFWTTPKKTSSNKAELVYEEQIDESDYEALLRLALKNKDYRSAVRYYYLTTLNLLSDKKLIELHKDKTNADYLFEIDNDKLRTDFSHLSYIFSYVWYGEFLLDEFSFKQAENKYQSFKSQLI